MAERIYWTFNSEQTNY